MTSKRYCEEGWVRRLDWSTKYFLRGQSSFVQMNILVMPLYASQGSTSPNPHPMIERRNRANPIILRVHTNHPRPYHTLHRSCNSSSVRFKTDIHPALDTKRQGRLFLPYWMPIQDKLLIKVLRHIASSIIDFCLDIVGLQRLGACELTSVHRLPPPRLMAHNPSRGAAAPNVPPTA